MMKSIRVENHGFQLLSSLSSRRGENHFGNVSVVTGDGHVSVHAVVLCSRSKFLEGLMLSAFMEEEDGCPVLCLPDVAVETLQNAISLLYSGSCLLQTERQIGQLNHLFSQLKITLNVSLDNNNEKAYLIQEVDRERRQGSEVKDSDNISIQPLVDIKDESEEHLSNCDAEEIGSWEVEIDEEMIVDKVENKNEDVENTIIPDSPEPSLNSCPKKGRPRRSKKHTNKCDDDSDWQPGGESINAEVFVERDKPLPSSRESGLPLDQVLKKHNLLFDDLVNDSNDVFACKNDGCEIKTKKRRDIMIHVLKHRGIKPYVCPTCDKDFSTSGNLRGHLRSHLKEEDRPYGCPDCSKRFTSRQKVTLHMRIHSGSKPCICPQCGKACTTNSELVSHQRSHGIGNDYVCTIPDCNKRFRYANSLSRHRQIEHEADKEKCRCDICGEVFSYTDKLRYHMKMKHMSKEERNVAEAHLKTHVCPECGKAWKNKGELETHMRSHSDERPFSCDQCGKGFKTPSALLTHLKFHTGNKNFTCDQCGRAFAMKGTLEAHYRLHTGEKPYSCTYCGKSFAQLSALQGHEARHRGEQPKNYKKKERPVERKFSCTNCGKSFLDNRDLSRHMVIHTGEKQFSCKFCPSKFNRKDNLLGHIRRSHVKDGESEAKKGRYRVPRDAVDSRNKLVDNEEAAQDDDNHSGNDISSNTELLFAYPAWLARRQHI